MRRAMVAAFLTATALVGGFAVVSATAETPVASGAPALSHDGSALERTSHTQAPDAIAWNSSVGSIEYGINW